MRSVGVVSASLFVVLCALSSSKEVLAWQSVVASTQLKIRPSSSTASCFRPAVPLFVLKDKTESKTAGEANKVEETTEKYGLEAGLFQSLRQEDGGESAKSLLKKYGIAYLATSIPLALVSFGICYVLVSNGVDVASLLSKVGIEQNAAAENAGTFAIAYAAHKAASPIRFPPTVLLTPVVAKLIGKEPEEDEGEVAS